MGLVIHSHEPFNAEPPLDVLRARDLTDASDFYVRSHGDTPQIDAAGYVLSVGGRVATPLRLTLEALSAMPRAEVEATMQCAGNRRGDMLKVRPVAGDPWSAGAIGNAVWSGVRLVDVLRTAGAETAPGLHVGFSSLDEVEMDGKRFRFGASIPIGKAMAPEVILAYAMNGEPLPPRHGFPLRVVTPGYAGVRSPKWLASIEVRDAPSDNPIQAKDYKLLPPDIRTVEEIDWSRGVTIGELPVNSAICYPLSHARLAAGPCRMRGWAAASGRGIARVDISSDGGRTWRQARLEPRRSPWSWVFWEAEIEIGAGEHELVVRAWDAAGQTQPALPDDTWNVKGYLSAAWHRVVIVAE